MPFKSDFLREIAARGFLEQCTEPAALDALAHREVVTAYIGFDATGDSLHVGHLVGIMLLRHLQRSGHRPIVLMGGGTTKVGDPSGKDQSRKLLSDAEIASNIASIKRIFSRFLAFGDRPADAVMVNNADWLDGLQYIPFLRDYGRHFSVNRMLKFDSVKLRLEREQPLSFLEFNYMILQAYDFLELARRHGCVLQMGGSDQWGNILNGIELARRIDDRTLFGLCAPLITTAGGAKMGKTAAGAVWLNADRLAPYDYWQYFRNADDADVGRFLRLFTDLPLDEISRLEALRGAEVNEAKIVLANETTKLAHGEEQAREAKRIAEAFFVHGDAHLVGTGAVVVNVSSQRLASGQPVLDLLLEAKLIASKSEGRRLIRQQGIRANDEIIESETRVMTLADLSAEGIIKLSTGKKKHAIVRIAAPNCV